MLTLDFLNQLPFLPEGANHGDGVLIECDGTRVLLDGGIAEAGPGFLAYMAEKGFFDIDELIITHYHRDHSALSALLLKDGRFHVSHISLPRYGARLEHAETAVLSLIAEKGIHAAAFSDGDEIDCGQLSLKAFWPLPGQEAQADTSTGEPVPDGNLLNNYSTVFTLSYGAFRMLFPADIHAETERALLARCPRELKADVLKIAHHGHDTSVCDEFLDAVGAKDAICMTRFVEPPVSERLARHGTRLYATCADGGILLTADADGRYRIQTRRDRV